MMESHGREPREMLSPDVLSFIKAVQDFIDKARHIDEKDLEVARDYWETFTNTFVNILKQRNLYDIVTPPTEQGDREDPQRETPTLEEYDVAKNIEELEEIPDTGTCEKVDDFNALQPEIKEEPSQIIYMCKMLSTENSKIDKNEDVHVGGEEQTEVDTGVENDFEIHVKVEGHTEESTENQNDLKREGKCVRTSRRKALSTKTSPVFTCWTCGHGFSTLSNVTRHVKRYHPGIIQTRPTTTTTSSRPANIKCDQCEKFFTSTSNLNGHINNCHQGKREFVCVECGKSFQTKSNLKRHVKSTHRGLKPFECNTCQARFTEKKSLERHIAIHTGPRVYRCDDCGKTVSTKWSLTQHQAQHANQRSHLCDTCGQTFITKCNLDSHKLIHLGQRKHPCSLCKRSFYNKGDLERHMRSHTGVKPFSCHVCSKAFSRQEYLTEHLNVHAGITPYICPTCEKVFSCRSGCHKHAKRCALKILTKGVSDTTGALEEMEEEEVEEEEEELLEGQDHDSGTIVATNESIIPTSVILPDPNNILSGPQAQTVTFIDIDVKDAANTDFTEALQMLYPVHDDQQQAVVTEHVIHVTSENISDVTDAVVGGDVDEAMTGEEILQQIHDVGEAGMVVPDTVDPSQDPTQSYCVLNEEGDENRTDFVIPAGTLVSGEMNGDNDLTVSNIQWYVQHVVKDGTWQDPAME